MRELNGWAPAQVTYSPTGEVLSTTVQEPRFSRFETDLLLAARRSALAPRGAHGLLLSETTDPDNQFAYEVPEPTTDHAQLALSNAHAAWAKANKDADPNTRLWRVNRRQPPMQ